MTGYSKSGWHSKKKLKKIKKFFQKTIDKPEFMCYNEFRKQERKGTKK